MSVRACLLPPDAKYQIEVCFFILECLQSSPQTIKLEIKSYMRGDLPDVFHRLETCPGQDSHNLTHIPQVVWTSPVEVGNICLY